MLVISNNGVSMVVGLEKIDGRVVYHLGATRTNPVSMDFDALEKLKNCESMSGITGNVTVYGEVIESPSGKYVETPISSNKLLSGYLVLGSI